MNRLTQARCVMGLAVAVIVSTGLCTPAPAQQAEWIWSAKHERAGIPQTACHFRKHFEVPEPRSGELLIAADDRYEVFLNGRRVGSGGGTDLLDKYDVSNLLSRGRNLVAVKAVNTQGGTAALAVQVVVDDGQRGKVVVSSDEGWKTNLRPLPFWFTPLYNDSRWATAQSFGIVGKTPPWDNVPGSANEPEVAGAPAAAEPPGPRQIRGDFHVDRVLDAETTGTLASMAFNEFGYVVAGRRGGPLLLIYDSDDDQRVDRVRVCSDRVKNCEGVLCLNGDVYVTGEGPDGWALYRLSDKDRDGRMEELRAVVRFEVADDHHGPHGIALGTDGFLYVALGCQTRVKRAFDDDSPYRDYYEGDLVQPRYELSGGHTSAAQAPGGAILRVDLEGNRLQLVAGGLHNAFDLAFGPQGDLFTCDPSTEPDLGTPWYRAGRVYHVISGAEFGWRSGWAKWPDYFVDVVPPVVELGPISPGGIVFYEHHIFPERYRHAFFVADPSKGRILAVRMKREKSSYEAESEVFLEDAPGISDLAVGADGALYFAAGGGLYRVQWSGRPSAADRAVGSGLSAVIRQPQLEAAWARQRLATAKNDMGDTWNSMMPGVALSEANSSSYRIRALSLMQLYGPAPTAGLLEKLADNEDRDVRGKAAELMGLYPSDQTRQALVALVKDRDPMVRRRACEALVRAGQTAPLEALIAPLGSYDPFESWAARRVLEQMPADAWRDQLLESDDQRLLIQGSLALLIADPSPENAWEAIRRIEESMGGFVSDRNFADLWRVLQLALLRGKIAPEDAKELKGMLADEFPSKSAVINRELVRLLAYLQDASIADRYLEYLNSDAVSELEKQHLALHLCRISDGWTADQRMQLLEYLEAAQRESAGAKAAYLRNAARDFAKALNDEQARHVLAQGTRWPSAALGVLYRMPEHLDWKTFDALKTLDGELAGREEPSANRLKTGIVAVMARSGDPQSMDYLRKLWDEEPERRPVVAMGLAQWPNEDNWYYLMRSMPVLEDEAAREVLRKLRSINLAPEEPEYYRQAILRGLLLGDHGAEDAVALLEYWTGEKHGEASIDRQAALAAWQRWYAEKWPDRPKAELPQEDAGSKWHYAQLLRELTGPDGSTGSPERGAQVFERARCVQCHRFRGSGEHVGPELTQVGKRLMEKQILQSILYPSHMIAGEYATATVTTKDGQKYTGVLSHGDNDGEVTVHTPDGKAVTVDADRIEDIKTEPRSAMPDGLLETLTLEDIADLFAYLKSASGQRVANQPALRIRK